jgi:hypothetical protein
MIRYAFEVATLRDRIRQLSSTWLERAAERTRTFRDLGHYAEQGPIWSDVKRAYMEIQGHKCMYCERSRPDLIDVDVEHFRPKGNIGQWPVPPALASEGVVCTPVPAPSRGYHLLPYHLLNYGAACKQCNTPFKSDHFPIAGAYQCDGDDPASMAGEQPFLIYPLGDLDADPETLIGFCGFSPVALPPFGHERRRALVTIAFFALGDPERRKDLFLERAVILMALYPQLVESRSGTGTEREAAADAVRALTASDRPHTNCARSFRRLFDASPDEAKAHYEAARAYFSSSSKRC